MIRKNVAGQGVYLYAHDKSADTPKTGDSANITGYVSKDGAAEAPVGSGVTEIDATNMPGVYWQPLAQGETNADAVVVGWKSTTANVVIEPLLVLTETLTASLATLAADVWASATRTLTSFGTLVADMADAVWDEATAGHQTAGTTGKALSDAGASGDPLSSAVPGAYAAGTAGYNLGLVDEIKAKTDLITSGTPIEVTSPTPEAGELELYAGDAYSLTHARSVDLAFTTAPDLTNAVVKLHVGTGDGGVLSITGSVLNPGTATQTCRFSYTAAQTALLTKVGGAYNYQVRATWAADSPTQPATIGEGRVTIKRQIPEV